ncbi:MAG: dihydropteroate synthase [Rhodospirillales bacterium]
MGIVNVTPDSFSDGGETDATAAAVDRGLAMLAEGADIIDVGGESTRPGALPVPVEAELARVVPVVRALAEAGAVVSVDTRHAAVMRAAIAAGARIVNDITALQGTPRPWR